MNQRLYYKSCRSLCTELKIYFHYTKLNHSHRDVSIAKFSNNCVISFFCERRAQKIKIGNNKKMSGGLDENIRFMSVSNESGLVLIRNQR